MLAYLVNPFHQTIKKIDYRGDYKAIYDLIKAQTFELAYLDRNGDAAYCDGEGLYKEDQLFWIHTGNPSPIAGIGLVLGVDAEGDSTMPKTSFARFCDQVEWCGGRWEMSIIAKIVGEDQDYRSYFFREIDNKYFKKVEEIVE